MQRPINKDYYFIDFHPTIDAIKYRIFHLTQQVKAMYKTTQEKKEYYCPRCSAQWTEMEVLDNVGPDGFICHRCEGLLEREEPRAGDSTGHEKQSRLMSQLEPLLKLLQQIDAEEIPNNDFENAIAHTVPVQRDPNVNAARDTVPVNDTSSSSTAVKGLPQTSFTPLDVSVTASLDKPAAEQASEAQRKANLAAQNALPVWHTTSTVTGLSTVDARKAGESQSVSSSFLKEDNDETKGNNVLNEELKAYFDEMAKEKEKQAREDLEADESSEDEFDEFEDVTIAQTGDNTPNDPLLTEERDGHPVARDIIKVKGSESGSSVPATTTSTPTALNGLQDAEHTPAVKKVKFEQDRMAAGDSDEDEDAEFEDAL